MVCIRGRSGPFAMTGVVCDALVYDWVLVWALSVEVCKLFHGQLQREVLAELSAS